MANGIEYCGYCRFKGYACYRNKDGSVEIHKIGTNKSKTNPTGAEGIIWCKGRKLGEPSFLETIFFGDKPRNEFLEENDLIIH